MKFGKLTGLALFISSAAFAAPSVSVYANCYYTTCTGGVQPGSVTTQGVLSLDVYASATAAAVLPPEQMNQPSDPFEVSVAADLLAAGSGPGILVIDPTYTFTTSVSYDAILEAVSLGDLNGNLETDCLRFGGGVSHGFGAPVCSSLTLVPITLGTNFTLTVTESTDPYSSIPAASTLTTDLDLYAISPTGTIIPVTLATDAIPEPADLTFLGLGCLACVGVHRRVRRVNSDLNPVQ